MRIAKIGHWFLLASLFVETLAVGQLTSAEYILGRAFGFERAYPLNYWSDVLGGLFICLFGFCVTGVVLLQHRWSKRLASGFCLATILFVLARATSTPGSNWWLAFEFCILPIAVLGYLTLDWISSRPTTHKAVQPS